MIFSIWKSRTDNITRKQMFQRTSGWARWKSFFLNTKLQPVINCSSAFFQYHIPVSCVFIAKAEVKYENLRHEMTKNQMYNKLILQTKIWVLDRWCNVLLSIFTLPVRNASKSGTQKNGINNGHTAIQLLRDGMDINYTAEKADYLIVKRH